MSRARGLGRLFRATSLAPWGLAGIGVAVLASCNAIVGIREHELASDAGTDADLDGAVADDRTGGGVDATTEPDASADAGFDGATQAIADATVDGGPEAGAEGGTSDGAMPFAPTALVGLGLWLRADTGVTAAGAGVSEWSDLSGNGNSFAQAVTSSQPALVAGALNGQPALRFDGATSFLRGAIASGLAYQTLCTVMQDDGSSSTNGDGIAAVLGAGGAAGLYVSTSGPAYQVIADGNGASSSTSVFSNSQPTAGYHVWCVVYPVASTTGGTSLYVDGILQNMYAGAGTSTNAPTTVAYAIGARNDGVAKHNWKGTLAEVVAYSRALSVGEITEISSYLMQRYGIFTPLVLPGCDLWFRPDYGVTQSGGGVSQWIDQAQGLVLQVRATTTFPGYSATGGPNSTPVLTFDGTKSLGIATTPANVAADPTRGTTVASVIFFDGQQLAYGTCSGSVPMHALQVSVRTQRLPGTTMADTNTTGTYAGTTAEAWVSTSTNGVQVFRVNGVSQPLSLGGAETGTFTPVPSTGFWFGAAPNGAHPLTGQLAEFIVYDRVLDTIEIGQLEAYLRARYALW